MNKEKSVICKISRVLKRIPKQKKKLFCIIVCVLIIGSATSTYFWLSGLKYKKSKLEYFVAEDWDNFLENLPFAANACIPILLNNSDSKNFIKEYRSIGGKEAKGIGFAWAKKVVVVVSKNLTRTYNIFLQNATSNWTFIIPEKTVRFKLTISCDSLPLSIIYPHGVLKEYENRLRIEEMFEHPLPGEWEIKVESGKLLSGNISIIYLTNESANDVIALANGPVLATLYQLPLKIIYENYTNIPLSPGDIIVDLNNRLKIDSSIKKSSTLLQYIEKLSDEKGAVFASLDKYRVATFFSAYNHIPVVFPDLMMENVSRFSEKLWFELYSGPPNEKFSIEKFKKHSQKIYHELKDSLAESLSIYNISFAGKGYIISNLSGIKIPLDLCMQTNMVVGRFVGTEDEILVYGNRGLFFDKVRKATNAWKKVMGCFISYSHGLNFTGEGIFVSETIRETFEWFSKYSIFTANTTAIIENLTKGVGIWYHSSHGWINFTSNEGGIYGWNGFCERSYEEGGNLSEPDADKTGLVDPKNTKKITEDDFSSIKLKNTVCIILACKIGSSNFPYTLLGSGAACVIASPVELSFRQGGFLTNKVGELLVNGETIGNAIKISINQTKERTEEFDAPFLCFGEPSIKVLDHKIKCEVSVPKKILIPEITKINIRVFNEVGKPVHDADVKVNNTNAKYNPLFNSYSISCGMLSDYTNNVTVEIHKDMCGTLTLNTTVYVYPKVYRVTLFIICGLVISMIAIVFWRYRTKKKLS